MCTVLFCYFFKNELKRCPGCPILKNVIQCYKRKIQWKKFREEDNFETDNTDYKVQIREDVSILISMRWTNDGRHQSTQKRLSSNQMIGSVSESSEMSVSNLNVRFQVLNKTDGEITLALKKARLIKWLTRHCPRVGIKSPKIGIKGLKVSIKGPRVSIKGPKVSRSQNKHKRPLWIKGPKVSIKGSRAQKSNK